MTRSIPIAVLKNGNLIPKTGLINSAVTLPIFPPKIPQNIRIMQKIKGFLLENKVDLALNELRGINAA